jgi:hypothetical protein
MTIASIMRTTRFLGPRLWRMLGTSSSSALVTKRGCRRNCGCLSRCLLLIVLRPNLWPRSGTDSVSPFICGEDITVSHDPSGLDGRRIGSERPDLIYGIRPTDQLKTWLANTNSSRHFPVTNLSILYPFLILESERRSAQPATKFTEQERRVAFTIRTLLKTQQDFQDSYSPVVWFLVHVGDAWRVYASMHNGLKYVRFLRGSIFLFPFIRVQKTSADVSRISFDYGMALY